MEYKVVPLPATPRKYKGVKNSVDRMTRTFTDVLNEEARGGWIYVRAEQVETEVKRGMLRGSDDLDLTMLVFSREKSGRARPASAARVRHDPAPVKARPVEAARPIEAESEDEDDETEDATATEDAVPPTGRKVEPYRPE